MVTKKIVKQSIILVLALSMLSAFAGWGNLKVVRLFGSPYLMPASIIIGGIIGIANLKGLVWGIESLLGSHKANTKLVYLSLFRLFIIFAIIIVLSLLRIINLLGLLIGMSAVFIIFTKEAIKMAKGQ